MVRLPAIGTFLALLSPTPTSVTAMSGTRFTEDVLPSIMGAALVVGIVTFWVLSVARSIHTRRKRDMDFDWYRQAHPSNVAANRVSCFGCGSTRIHARGLMQQTFLREHFCTTCGKTLYYSAEDNARA